MYKNSNITNFFKPFSHPQRNKRPLSEDDNDSSRRLRRSRSITPELAISATKPLEINDSARQNSALINPQELGNNPPDRPLSPKHDSICRMSWGRQEMFHQHRIGSLGPGGHIVAGSQRVMIDGKVTIQNSDDESESDISLDDIDDLLVARRHTMASSPPTEPDPHHPPSLKQEDVTRASIRDKNSGSTRPDATYLSSALPVIPKYKFSLKTLEKKAKDEKAAELGFSKARSLLDSLEHEKRMPTSKARKVGKTGEKFNAELVTAVMKDKDNEEGISRLMTAIERTEAFHQGKTWSFFTPAIDPILLEQADFPLLDDVHWHGVLTDTMSRQQAFLGGFVGDMASKKKLPEDLLLWILDAACLESKDDLRCSYASTFKEAQDQLTSLLTPSRIDMLFRRTGASIEALNIKKPILPSRGLSQNKNNTDFSRLILVLGVLDQTSPYMNTESQIHAICLLSRLLLDTSIVKDCRSIMAVDRTFTSLVDAAIQGDPENQLHSVLITIYSSVTDTTLRLQLLKNIPTSSNRLNLFRRRLALSFFFEDMSLLSKPAKSLLNLRSISHHLQDPQFAIRHDTDYSDLAASIAILAIAVDNGDPPEANTDKQENTAFNKDVDALSRRIHTIFTSIVDTGASHMKRTEAKEVLEGFHSRLQYAVRTKRKPKSMLFGNSMLDGELDSMKNGLQSFLQSRLFDTPV